MGRSTQSSAGLRVTVLDGSELTHSDGPRVRANFSAVGTRVIELNCMHAVTNYVMLSRTILMCAAEIKHA